MPAAAVLAEEGVGWSLAADVDVEVVVEVEVGGGCGFFFICKPGAGSAVAIRPACTLTQNSGWKSVSEVVAPGFLTGFLTVRPPARPNTGTLSVAVAIVRCAVVSVVNRQMLGSFPPPFPGEGGFFASTFLAVAMPVFAPVLAFLGIAADVDVTSALFFAVFGGVVAASATPFVALRRPFVTPVTSTLCVDELSEDLLADREGVEERVVIPPAPAAIAADAEVTTAAG